MKIEITRSGGFAGLEQTLVSLDTATMEPAAARELAALLREIGFFELPEQLASGDLGADFFRYRIRIADGSRRHAVSYADDGGPEALRLGRLLRLAGVPT